MSSYATIAEIRARSTSIPKIVDGSDGDINLWSAEAFARVNNFCNQSFAFEQQATKTVKITHHPTIILPKVMGGDVSASTYLAGDAAESIDINEYLELEDDAYTLRYLGRNVSIPTTSALYLTLTADWGYPATLLELIVASANDLKSKYNTHRVSTAFHSAADNANVTSSPTATSLATAITLLNELKGDLNAHAINVVSHLEAGSDLVTSPDATTEATAATLAADIKAAFNLHIASTDIHLEADPLPSKMSVTNTLLPEEIKIAFVKVTQRIALRDNKDDIRYHNSGFASESWGDGYSYNLGNASLRSMIHPNDAVLLWNHVHDGRVVS